MPSCAPFDGFNPSQIQCDSPWRMFAQIGLRDSGDWEHSTRQTITLDGVEIFSTDRLAGMSWNEYSEATDAIACMVESDGGGYAFFSTSSYKSEPYKCDFKEKNTITSNEILFLDLRHDIMVRKEIKHVYDQSKESEDSTLWNNFGSVVKTHKIAPGDMPITETQKLYVNDTLIDEETLLKYALNPFALSVPPLGGEPQSNTQTNGVDDLYYIWADHKEEDGGYDLYYPDWVRDINSVAKEFDIENRDRHRALSGVVPYDREPVSGAINVFNDLIVSPTGIFGSWAVSPIKDVAGLNLRAYTTLKLDRTSFENYLYPVPIVEDQDITDSLFGNPVEILCPIAPL